jgi:hypothetical protein
VDQTYQFTAAQGLQQINRGWEQPLTVVNAGAISLQVTDDPNGGSIGLALPPGASIVWDAGRPLNAYVLTGTAGTAILTVLENGGTIANPAAIAAALVASGLTADAIGSAIALQGAPPLNRFDLTANAVTGNIANNGTLLLGPWDIRKYNAIRGLFQYSIGGVTIIQPPLIRPLDFHWLLDNNGSPGAAVDAERYYVYGGTNFTNHFGLTGILTPIKGAWLEVLIGAEVGASLSPGGGAVQYSLIGQYLSAGDPVQIVSFFNWGNNSGWAVDGRQDQDNYWWISGAKVNGINVSDYPPVQSGPVYWQASVVAVTTAVVQVQLLDAVDNTSVVDQFTFPVSATGTSQARQIILPNRPITLRVIGGGCTNVAVSMSSLPR